MVWKRTPREPSPPEADDYPPLSEIDAQTRLPGRRLFNDELRAAVENLASLDQVAAVIILDLHHFRDVNWNYGEQAGNTILAEFATRLKEAVRTTDYVARVGDDEFAVLLPSALSEGHALLAANKIMEVAARPYEVGEHRVVVQVNIGLNSVSQGGSAEAGFAGAAKAMYQAKRSRENLVVYHEPKPTDDVVDLGLETELQKAIIREELVLYYQAKQDIHTRQITGAEALVRWAHPERGLVGPGKFIPLAERSRFIDAVTLWGINKAAHRASQWLEEGLELTISVNLSASNLEDPDLPGYVARTLELWRLKPEMLCLEITETTFMDRSGHILNTLNKLKEIGVKLSIDDFGTGYSSLAYLKDLPVDELKIDQAFVFKMHQSHDDEMIVRTIINLGHNFGLKVTAEGVEDDAQYNELKRLGCDIAQGYYIARPVPPNEFLAKLRRNRQVESQERLDEVIEIDLEETLADDSARGT